MPPSDETFLPYLEWDFINKPISITTVEEHEQLPSGQKIIAINRNEDYNLKAILQFEDNNYIFSKDKTTGVVGTAIRTFTIKGLDEEECKYELESSHVGNIKNASGTNEKKLANTAEIGFHGLKMETNNKKQVAYLTEWCLNGPRDFIFSSKSKKNKKNL